MQRRPEDRPPAQNEKISLKSLLKMFLKFRLNFVEIFEIVKKCKKSQNKHSENWVPKKLENHVRGGEV